MEGPRKAPREGYTHPKLLLLPMLAATVLTACGTDTQQSPIAQTTADPVVARIGKSAITLTEVDQQIRLERHDLALAEYQLRFNTLKSMVDAELTASATTGKQPAVDWLLPHPSPPRLDIDTAERPLRGNPEAPVTLAVFCSYQSVHCAATNLVLRELLDRYAG